MSPKLAKYPILLAMILFTLFIYSCGKGGQGNVGDVEGTVTDSSTGVALSGVTVQIEDQVNVTGDNGVYSIQNLDIGTRTVTASKTGYQNYNGICEIIKGTIVTFDMQLTLNTSTDTTPPSINSTNPANNVTDVAVNSAVIVAFTEALDVSTITTATFTLKQGTTSIPGTVTYSGTTATFTPSRSLSYNTTYTATITTGVKDTAGNAMTADYLWNFTTGALSDTTPPTVNSTNPANNDSSVAVNAAINATFTEALDVSTITTATFTLKQGTTSIPGTVTYSGTTTTFTPSSSLSYNTTYTATITTGVKDTAGNAMTADYLWNFTTGALSDTTPPTVNSTNPANNDSSVAVNAAINATFTEALDVSTITTATFTLKQGTTSIPGTVTYSGTTATFTPSSNLSYNTTYSATITTGVKDTAGNAMATDYTWSFNTTPATLSFASYVMFSTGSRPEAVAIGDVNGDGRNDVVMTTSYNSDSFNDYKLFVFLQTTSGGLDTPIKYSTSGTYSCRPQTVAIGDVNHDGKNDVVVGNSGSGIEVFLQNSSGGLNSGVVYTKNDSNKIKIADLNNDGLMDVVGIGWGTNTVSVWPQNANGILDSPVTHSVTHGGYDDLDIGDVNNDGLPDIVVMSGQSTYPNIGVLTQKSDGTFNSSVYYNIGSSILSHGVAIGDVNGDNLKDIVITYGGNSPSSKIGAFLQNGSGTLDSTISYDSDDNPQPVEIKDVNQDGRQDVIVAHGGWNALGVYLQGTDGNLMSENLFSIPYASQYNPHGLGVEDINGDDLNDVVIADPNNGLVVLYHQ